MKDVKAAVFDVFGTRVGWRTSIARELQAVFGDRADAFALADAWPDVAEGLQMLRAAITGSHRVPTDISR
jgi:FMN phosphatase YigB (HAD superfamily)